MMHFSFSFFFFVRRFIHDSPLITMCNIAILFLFILSFPYVVIVNNALTAIESLITLIVDSCPSRKFLFLIVARSITLPARNGTRILALSARFTN